MTRPGVCLPGAVWPAQAQRLAAEAEAAGCEAVWVLDVRRDPFLLSAAAVTATKRVQVGPNVAVAFARSPVATAAAAWDLQGWGGGRFVLGLGSQVGPVLASRFGIVADHPAARMRDYINAVRAAFAAFKTGRGRHGGPYYRFQRPFLQPGADKDQEPPPIYLSAVNPVMTRTAGGCADGLAAHPFTTAAYLKEVLRPALKEGAGKEGRPPPAILLQLVVAADRATAARQMLAYSVPAYRRVLDHAGLTDVADAVIAATGAGLRSEALKLVDEHYLDRLGVVYFEDLEAGIARWAPHCDRLSLSVPWFGIDDETQISESERLIRSIESLP